MTRRLIFKNWHCLQCGKSGVGPQDAEMHAREHHDIECMLRAAGLPYKSLLPVRIKLDPVREWG